MPPSTGIDATVVAIPLYFGSMEAERRWLRTRAELEGPSPADYERPDTAASLAMAVASLVVPLASHRLVRHVTPGRGRFGRALVGTAVGAVVATTLADRALARTPADDPAPRARRVRRWARRVARVGGPVAVATGGLAVASTVTDRTSPARMWRKGQAHDHLLLEPPLHARGSGHVGHPRRAPFERALQPRRAEEVLNTPSHHRVHHGSNQRYLDRNHGSILIVWDRLFGTFQREGEPVVYGLTKNIDTYSPARIATHEYRDIVRDIAASTTWTERLSFVLRGPGWAKTRTVRT
jgi:hypothetical protein